MSYQIPELRKISPRIEYGKFVFLVPENMGTPLGSLLRSFVLCEFFSFGVTLVSFPINEYERFSGLQESIQEFLFNLKNIVFLKKDQTNNQSKATANEFCTNVQNFQMKRATNWSLEKLNTKKKNYFQLHAFGVSADSARACADVSKQTEISPKREVCGQSSQFLAHHLKEDPQFLSFITENKLGVLFLDSYQTLYTKDICYPDDIEPLDPKQKICSTGNLDQADELCRRAEPAAYLRAPPGRTDLTNSSLRSKMIVFNFGYEKKSSQTPRASVEIGFPEFFSFQCSPPPAVQKINFTIKKNIQNFESIYFEIYTNGSVSPLFVFEWMKKKAIFEMQNSMQNQIFTPQNATN